jgi:hypothetical protein
LDAVWLLSVFMNLTIAGEYAVNTNILAAIQRLRQTEMCNFLYSVYNNFDLNSVTYGDISLNETTWVVTSEK